MAAVPNFHYSYDAARSLFQADAVIFSNILAFTLAKLVQCAYVTYTCARSHKHTFTPAGPRMDTHSPLY